MDLSGDDGVTIAGLSTRGGAVAGARQVRASAGVTRVDPAEMIVACGAATPVDELSASLAEVGQRVTLPPGGTVGGALAVGESTIRRLGDGPIRDALLQANVALADGRSATAGGPTVKNVSGYDLCRLLVGSHGSLAFIDAVIMRTRPVPSASQWFVSPKGVDLAALRRALFRPVSVLFDGDRAWVLLEGHPRDVELQAVGLDAVDRPPPLPAGRRSMTPADALAAVRSQRGLVAEVGVGIVHGLDPLPHVRTALERRIKTRFDPRGRLNPGR
jgi:FAD/FMN-containing dehydrogenase